MKETKPEGTNVFRREKNDPPGDKPLPSLELLKKPESWMEDEELIRACQRGDRRSMELLYRQYAPRTHAFLGRIMGPDRSLLDDLVHDVFLEVMKSIKRFKFQSKFSTWLYSVTVRVANRHRRRKILEKAKLKVLSPSDLHATPPTPVKAMIERERNDYLWGLLKNLSESKRVALVLAEAEGLSAQEVADITGARIETVYSRLHYARKEIMESILLDGYLEGGPDD